MFNFWHRIFYLLCNVFLVFTQGKLLDTLRALSWFLLRRTKKKPLQATVRSFMFIAAQRHGRILILNW